MPRNPVGYSGVEQSPSPACAGSYLNGNSCSEDPSAILDTDSSSAVFVTVPTFTMQEETDSGILLLEDGVPGKL